MRRRAKPVVEAGLDESSKDKDSNVTSAKPADEVRGVVVKGSKAHTNSAGSKKESLMSPAARAEQAETELRQLQSVTRPAPWEVSGRALAVYRVALGLVVVLDMGLRARHLDLFYSDNAVCLNSHDGARHKWDVFRPGIFSAHHLLPATVSERVEEIGYGFGLPQPFSGESGRARLGLWWPALVMIITAVFGISLACGFRPRRSSLVCWFLICAVQERAITTQHAGDDHLRTMLFLYAMMPSQSFKIEGAIKDASIASYAMLAQAGSIYTATAYGKLGSGDKAWRPPLYTAVQLSVQIQEWSRPLGRWLADQAELCRWLTWSTLVLQLCGGAFLVLCPILGLPRVISARLRQLTCFLLCGWQAGVALSFSVDTYQLLSIIALVPFVMNPPRAYHMATTTVGWSLGRVVTWFNSRLVIVFIFFCLGSNVVNSARTWDIFSKRVFNDHVRVEYTVLMRNFRQSWLMFPGDIHEFGAWHVLAGELSNGSFVAFPTPNSDIFNTIALDRWPAPLSNQGLDPEPRIGELKRDRPIIGGTPTVGTLELRRNRHNMAFQMDKPCALNFPRFLCQGWNHHAKSSANISELKRVQLAFVHDWIDEKTMKRRAPKCPLDEHFSVMCKDALKKRKTEVKQQQKQQGGTQTQWYSVYLAGSLVAMWLLPLGCMRRCVCKS